VGSHRSSRVHARSDAREPIDEVTMRRQHHSCEREEGKHTESVKNHLMALLFFIFAKFKIANSWRRAIFYSLYCFRSWQDLPSKK